MDSLEKVRYGNIRTLFVTLASMKDWALPKVRTKFLNDGMHFSETLELLSDLSFVRVLGNVIAPGPLWRRVVAGGENLVGDLSLKALLSGQLLNRKGSVSGEVEEFLSKFTFEGVTWRVKLDTKDRVRLSGIRNLLIDLGVVSYEENSDTYQILECDVSWWQSESSRRRISRSEMAKILQAREVLGREVEIEVINYEKRRLAARPDLAARIEHTADLDVNAGYDILSFDMPIMGAPSLFRRLIEVKAVSLAGFPFFWSRNEIQTARRYPDSYHLYLVPVCNSRILIHELITISHPVTEVLENPSKWTCVQENLSFSLRDVEPIGLQLS